MRNNTTTKMNNQGFTLVELIISFAILVIVSIAVVGMMSTGMRFFRSTTSNIGLQYEYQTVMTQLREYVVDCNAGIAVEGDTLYIVMQEDDPASPVGVLYRTYAITRSGTNLYFAGPADSITGIPAYIPIPADPSTVPDTFFEMSVRMTDFDVTIQPKYAENISSTEDYYYAVSIITRMGFSANERSYVSSQDIAMRNRVFTPVEVTPPIPPATVPTFTFGDFSDLRDILDIS